MRLLAASVVCLLHLSIRVLTGKVKSPSHFGHSLPNRDRALCLPCKPFLFILIIGHQHDSLEERPKSEARKSRTNATSHIRNSAWRYPSVSRTKYVSYTLPLSPYYDCKYHNITSCNVGCSCAITVAQLTLTKPKRADPMR